MAETPNALPAESCWTNIGGLFHLTNIGDHTSLSHTSDKLNGINRSLLLGTTQNASYAITLE